MEARKGRNLPVSEDCETKAESFALGLDQILKNGVDISGTLTSA
jgi:hypothetical protein